MTSAAYNPTTWVTWRHRWYLVAWDHHREDWRTFRVDRIRPRTPTGPRFTPRDLPGDTVSTFITSRFRGNDDGTATDWPCQGEVILRLPAADVAPFTRDGIVEELGSRRCRLILGSWSWTGLAAAIGRFDTEIEVIGPPRLATACGDLAARYAHAAQLCAIEVFTALQEPRPGDVLIDLPDSENSTVRGGRGYVQGSGVRVRPDPGVCSGIGMVPA